MRQPASGRCSVPAASALAGSTGWPILLEMDAEGDYPEVVWEYAWLVNDGAIDHPHGGEITPFGPTMLATYEQALGCGEGG